MINLSLQVNRSISFVALTSCKKLIIILNECARLQSVINKNVHFARLTKLNDTIVIFNSKEKRSLYIIDHCISNVTAVGPANLAD